MRSGSTQSALLLKQRQVDAFVSMGNTGAMLSAALLHLGRIPGVKRPALSTVFPTVKGFRFVLDIGANTDCRPTWLQQFAIMGSVYAERVLGLANPTVGLLSNGEEETKGSQLVQETHQLLKTTPGIRFFGNVEGKDITAGLADVVVTDGFTGNVVIKLAEGVASMFKTLLKEELSRSPISMVGGLLAKGGFDRLAARLDYAEYGGAPLLGVDGVVIVGHGRSNAWAVRNAIRLAMRAVESGMLEKTLTQLFLFGGRRRVPVVVSARLEFAPNLLYPGIEQFDLVAGYLERAPYFEWRQGWWNDLDQRPVQRFPEFPPQTHLPPPPRR